jgi:sulfate adenylyltransferase
MNVMTTIVDSVSATRVARPSTFAIPPHGGTLVNRFVTGAEAEDVLARARTLPAIALDGRAASDAELVATGALSPLVGFVGEEDYFSIVRRRRLANGVLFPIPITLSVPGSRRSEIGERKELALKDERGDVVGVIAVESLFVPDRVLEAKEVYKTTEDAHPGVAAIQRALKDGPELAIGGRITLAKRPTQPKFPTHHRDPRELRALIAERGWRRTVAFQTRNPIHRAHEYLLRTALEIADGLVVHPLVGETKGDDVPAAVRVKAYEALLSKYFPKERVVLSAFPFAMRYAGPREALLHAIARQNYGFSHFIVGRDHAGVGKYYGTYDAQRAFDELEPNDLAITILAFEHSFFCSACGTVASIKTCPHDETKRLALSGTKVRELLAKGEALPEEFTRPEVAEILREAYSQKS